MMRDEIFYGNVLGLLKTGKWNLSVAEAAALIQVIQECERRRKPPVVSSSPVDPVKGGRVKKK